MNADQNVQVQDTGPERRTATQHTLTDFPVLGAYRHPDGGHLLAWCPHEQRWHVHGACRQAAECERREFSDFSCTCPAGSGDGHRGAHCTCQLSPLGGGYYLREIGVYGPGVPNYVDEDTAVDWACSTWAGYPCTWCAERGQCSCEQPKCPDDSLCAEHADPECKSCWSTHGGPGYGHCEQHGIVAMHAHPKGKGCRRGDDGICDSACRVTRFWSSDGTGVHVHCPACWAADTLRSREPGMADWYAVPPCKGCRKLVTAGQLGRITAYLEQTAAWSAQTQAFLDSLPDTEWQTLTSDLMKGAA